MHHHKHINWFTDQNTGIGNKERGNKPQNRRLGGRRAEAARSRAPFFRSPGTRFPKVPPSFKRREKVRRVNCVKDVTGKTSDGASAVGRCRRQGIERAGGFQRLLPLQVAAGLFSTHEPARSLPWVILPISKILIYLASYQDENLTARSVSKKLSA